MTHGRISACGLLAIVLLTAMLPAVCSAAAEDPAPDDSYSRLVADYDSQREAARAAVVAAKTETETAAARNRLPDTTAFSRRALAIAEAKPQTVDARDALLWILYQPGLGLPKGERADLERRAMQLLLAQHSDDVEVARLALLLNHNCWINRERLIEGLAQRAKNPETKTLARVALARYWMEKIDKATDIQAPDAPTKCSNADFAETWADMRACDIPGLRAKTATLLEEIIAKEGDVPFVRGAEKREFDERRGQTVSTVATELLDQLKNFNVGNRAPEIDGRDLAGDPLKLSDYRGKVVVLVFWASWCGPCMQDVPHELELIAKHKDDPFVLLGVTVDEHLADAEQAIAEHHITWRNWHDPLTPDAPGPIVRSYHVRGFPGVFVLDADGVLRAKHCYNERLDKMVDELLKELKEKKPRS